MYGTKQLRQNYSVESAHCSMSKRRSYVKASV